MPGSGRWASGDSTTARRVPAAVATVVIVSRMAVGRLIRRLLDPGERGKRGAQPGQLGGRTRVGEQQVDVLDPGAHRGGCGTAPLGQPDRQPTAIVGVDLAVQVAAHHQGVDHLAGSLLGDVQLPDEVTRGPAAADHPAEDVGPVAGEVVEARGRQPPDDRLPVRAAGRAEQRWDQHPILGHGATVREPVN
jgi:hypothetical protein